jgi:dTDP-4-dehydrorhamnose reductase
MATTPQKVCLLFGGNGQVGHALQPYLENDYALRALVRADCDVADLDAVARIIAEMRPGLIINATAYNAVDQAESEPDQAIAINRDAVATMAEGARHTGAAFVHYSTDYVFDGKASVPYMESDATGPLGAYARSKLAGEQMVQSILPATHPYWVLRTSWVFGTHGSNFLKSVLNLARTRDALSMVDDQIGTPTSADVIARVTAAILRQRPASGLYHLSCRGQCTRFDYAKHILNCAEAAGDALRVNAKALKPIASAEYPTLAQRPLYSALDSSKLETALGMVLPQWQDEVGRIARELCTQETLS